MTDDNWIANFDFSKLKSEKDAEKAYKRCVSKSL
mgnify:CR=1 FL=1